MPVLVLRHEPFEHLGHFERVLNEDGVPFHYIDLGEPLPEPGSEPVIIMGGPQSANDPDPHLRAELGFIRESISKKVPVLGICLGSQLIAKALGAPVYKNAVKEIGWAPVYFTEAGKKDTLFTGLPSPTTLFHWHGETFDLPENAEWLAYSDQCRHQAFRYGQNVYGLQFHPEITPEMIVDWSTQPVNCGDVEALPAPIDPHAFETSHLARHVLEAWLTLLSVRR
jgi:GMP synthase (glutamine-hydrolysing)